MDAVADIEVRAVGFGLFRLTHGQSVVIGRAHSCGIRINDPLISSRHALLHEQGGRWVLEDLRSTNGTWVDGRRVDSAVVDDGSYAMLGDPGIGTAVVIRAVSEPVRATLDLVRAAPSSTAYLGRDAGNTWVVNDALASRRHARIDILADGSMLLRDLGSMNGTQVNGQPITQVVLREGDVVTVGNTDLVVCDGDLRQRWVGETSRDDLTVAGVDFTVGAGVRLLRDIDLTAATGTLTALIGPSGAGKSTLGRLLTGLTRPSAGSVTFAGHDVHAEYAALRSRIGFVPQDDVVHPKLTVRKALEYAAELRLPIDTSPQDRRAVCDEVMAELGLTQRADLRIEKLSGGQRKRVSVAIELITSPSLLVLDEPTSGLDPALDRQVMELLVELAQGGRIVIVVTHSLAYLHLVDQVLLLGPGGLPAYVGAPDGVADAFGTSDWASVFQSVTDDPQSWWRRYLERSGRTPAQIRAIVDGADRGAPRPNLAPPLPSPPKSALRQQASRQTRTLIRRQVRLIVSDVGYGVFLAALPIVLGLLALVVPGSNGFGPVPAPTAPTLKPSTEAMQILVLMVLGVCFMGASLSVRDLVGERAIYERERSAGLAASAYLRSKIVVFVIAAAIQSSVLTGIVLLGKPRPQHGVLFGSGGVELLIDLAVLAGCSTVLGLAMSSLVKSNDQAMPVLVVLTMAQLVMCGGLIPVTGRAGLEQLSVIFPARWGFAAGASTVDVHTLVPTADPDSLWRHDLGHWLLAMAVLVAIAAVCAMVTYRRVQLKRVKARA